jgi:hypothetical protein
MGAIEMRTILLLLVAVVVLLVATNPTRGEFNDWIMQYAAQKVRDDARAQKRDVSWGERMVGGYSTGWVLSSLPVARSNYLVFSVYRIDLPQELKRDFPSCVLAVAGQFIPRVC